jgi:acetolactate synthase-1/2/3 large subunit
VSLSGGELVVRALEDEGVPFTFGIPGTHNIELYDALATSKSVRPILVTDEQSAGFMADAVWRSTRGRTIGCANIVPGAGLTHAMSGIAEAYMDTVPMLVLGCGIRRDSGRAYQLHDVDQIAMVKPVTKAQFLVRDSRELYRTVREACRVARSGAPGPVFVEVPADLYLLKGGGDTSYTPAPAAPAAPDPADLDRVVALLTASRRPLLYLGLGAAGAGKDLVRLAERLEAPVATTFQGKGVFPESHPLALWPGFGDAAPPFARAVAGDRDLTIAIGCRFGEVATGSYGLSPRGPLVHVDIERAVLGRNFPAKVAIAADAAAFVTALLARLPHLTGGVGGNASGGMPDEKLRARIRAGHDEVRAGWLSQAGTARVTPYRLLHALQERLGDETIFTSDSGNGTFLAVECLMLNAPGRLLAPVDYSCMGYAIPAAIGARLACPDTPVVALAGDGALLMTGLELLTAAHEGVGVAVFALRDRELAQIAQFQSVAMNRKTSSVLPDYDLSKLCEAVGVECLRLDTDDGIDAVVERVKQVTGGGRPVAVDVAIDYSNKTYFTRGVVRTNLGRLPWSDRLRFICRALGRRVFA